jgi:hypothetical protein
MTQVCQAGSSSYAELWLVETTGISPMKTGDNAMLVPLLSLSLKCFFYPSH